jgi:sugar O-acyltransferase (sialic acid O-acetyltransferase NeuD family)
MKTNLIILGAGNVGAFIAYNLPLFEGNYNLLGFLDDDSKKHDKFLAGYKILGSIAKLNDSPSNTAVAVCVASPIVRKKIVERINSKDFHFPNLIASRSWLSNAVSVGKGIIIYPGVSVNYESKIGDFVIINMNCGIGHNTTISDYCTLAPGVNTAGFTFFEECVDAGIGACTRQNVRIGKNSIVSGEAMVLADVPENSLAMGVPAVVKSKN